MPAQELFKRQREVHNGSTRDLLLLRPFEEGTEHIENYQTDAEHNRYKAAADSLRRSAGISAHRPWYLIDPEASSVPSHAGSCFAAGVASPDSSPTKDRHAEQAIGSPSMRLCG